MDTTNDTAKRATKMFPIMHGDDVPWEIIAPCWHQAKLNHGRTLAEVAENGGLSPHEAIAILDGHRQRRIDNAAERLREIVRVRYYLVEIERMRAALITARDYIAVDLDGALDGACSHDKDGNIIREEMDEESRPLIEEIEQVLAAVDKGLSAYCGTEP